MPVRLYQSTDPSAPILTGLAGSLVSLFDAVLVNGYGSLVAAGWAKTFSGANLAAYRPPSGNRLLMRVDDTVTQDSRIGGFETMSDVNTGTGPFPTAAQLSGGGIFLRKSSTADATVRPWVMVASSTAFYLFVAPSQTTTTTWVSTTSTDGAGQMFFGDLISYQPGDAFSTMIAGPISAGGANGRLGQKNNNLQGTTITAVSGHWIARAFTQALGAISISKQVPGDYSDSTTIAMSSQTLPVFPDACSGNVLMANIEIIGQGGAGTGYVIRSRMPGGFSPLHQLPGNHGDIIFGNGAFAGRSWLNVGIWNTSTLGRLAVELTNNW